MLGRRTVRGGVAMTLLMPSALRAQRPSRAARLGVLLYTDPGADPNTRALREGLRARGYVEGQNLSIDYRSAEAHRERLPELAADLVRAKPDLIFALGGDVAPHVTAATTAIPIVFVVSNDPVRTKLVRSLAAPGGNVTGVTLQSAELAPKRLQLLKQAAPGITRVAVVRNPDHADDELAETQAAARALGMHVTSIDVRADVDHGAPLQAAVSAGTDGLIAVSARSIVRRRNAIVEFAGKNRLPLAGGWGLWAESGALMSYGPDLDAMVLRGTKPADLPIQQAGRGARSSRRMPYHRGHQIPEVR